MADQVLQDIKDRLNIADVISGYIQIKKAGTNFKALCPFHNEKSPSLQISPQKQIWHCFGCGLGGDVLAFVMRAESISFPAACRLLADRYGVALEDKPLTPSEARAARAQRIYNERVAVECGYFWRWYVRLLEQYRADTWELAEMIRAWIAAHPAARGVADARRQWFRAMRGSVAVARLLVAIQRSGPVTRDRMYRRLRRERWVQAPDVSALDGLWGPAVTDAVLGGAVCQQHSPEF